MKKNPETKINTLALLQEWVDAFAAIDAEYEKLRDIFDLAPEGRFSKAMYGSFQSYTKALALLLDDDDDWMNWFIWENESGKKAMEAKAANWSSVRPIRNVRDLEALIRNDCES